MTKIQKAQRIANQTGRDQLVIKSCYGQDIVPYDTIFVPGKTIMLGGCTWTVVKAAH